MAGFDPNAYIQTNNQDTTPDPTPSSTTGGFDPKAYAAAQPDVPSVTGAMTSHDFLPALKQAGSSLFISARDALTAPPQGNDSIAGSLIDKGIDAVKGWGKDVGDLATDLLTGSPAKSGGFSTSAAAPDNDQQAAADTASGFLPNLPLTAVNAYVKSKAAGNSDDDALKDARNASVMVGGLGAVGFGAGKLANMAAPAVENAADAATLKAIGPTINQQEALANRGVASQLAKSLRDEGVVTAGSTPQSMLPRLDDYLGKKGVRIGEIRDAADAAGAQTDMTRLQTMARLQQEAAQGSNEANQAMADAYSRNADRFATVPNRTLAQTQDEIQGLNSQIPFQKDFADMTPSQQAFKELRGDLADQMKDQIQLRTPENVDEYGDTLKQFSLFKNAEPILDKAAARQAVRGSLGLKDIMTGALGENGVQRGTFAVLSKLAREHGASTAAVSLGRMADLMQTNPAALGQFGTVLGAAAQKGPEAVQAAHAAFMANPDYTKRLGGAP